MPIDGQASDLALVNAPFNLLEVPTWSTDGRWLAFTRPLGEGGYPEIFLYDVTTGTEHPTEASGFWPHLFVPDGG